MDQYLHSRIGGVCTKHTDNFHVIASIVLNQCSVKGEGEWVTFECVNDNTSPKWGFALTLTNYTDEKCVNIDQQMTLNDDGCFDIENSPYFDSVICTGKELLSPTMPIMTNISKYETKQNTYLINPLSYTGKELLFYLIIQFVVIGIIGIAYYFYMKRKQIHSQNPLTDNEIINLFYKTVLKADYNIIKINNITTDKQNDLYESQLQKICALLQRDRKGAEKYLWHGSDYNIIKLIKQNGFDRSYSTTAVYGTGTYFAKKASYSVGFGYCPLHLGYQYIMLCKVIVGDSINGRQSMKKMPKKLNGMEYDTLVDDVNNPSIYVVWRDYRAVPMYLIKFQSTS